MWQLFNSNMVVNHTLTSAGTKVTVTRNASTVTIIITENNGVARKSLQGAGLMSYYLYDYRYALLLNGALIDAYEISADNPYATGTTEYPIALAAGDTVSLRLEVRRKSVLTDSLTPVHDTGYRLSGGLINTYLKDVKLRYDNNMTVDDQLSYNSYYYTASGSRLSRLGIFDAGEYSILTNYDLDNYNYAFLLYVRNTQYNLVFEPRYAELTKDTPTPKGSDILSFGYLQDPDNQGVIYATNNLQYRMVIYAIPKASSRVKINGSWKRATGEFCKINGSWKRVVRMYTKIDGTWKGNFK